MTVSELKSIHKFFVDLLEGLYIQLRNQIGMEIQTNRKYFLAKNDSLWLIFKFILTESFSLEKLPYHCCHKTNLSILFQNRTIGITLSRL